MILFIACASSIVVAPSVFERSYSTRHSNWWSYRECTLVPLTLLPPETIISSSSRSILTPILPNSSLKCQTSVTFFVCQSVYLYFSNALTIKQPALPTAEQIGTGSIKFKSLHWSRMYFYTFRFHCNLRRAFISAFIFLSACVLVRSSP